MPHSNYTTSEDRQFSLIPWKSYKKTVMQRRMVLRLPRDRRETGIAPITVPCGRPTPGWHSAALYTAQRSVIYWGLHHGGHPPHTGCDARVSPGAGC